VAAPLLALLPSLLPIFGEVLDRVVPDQQAAAKARLELEAKLLEAASAQAGQQVAINQVEAANPSIFVSGWRPFIGWVCGAGLAWTFIFAPLLAWLLPAIGVASVMPVLQVEYLLELVVAMLGLGALRSFEKLKGVAAR
jgi:hypothetical protein